MLKRFMANGFKRLGSVADDGSYYLKRVICDNGTWNASKGARAQARAIGTWCKQASDNPAGTIITDFVKMNSDDTVAHYLRRSSLNAPQGSSVLHYRGPSDDVLMSCTGWWHC